MSTNTVGTLPQAMHTLRLLDDQKLSVEQVETLHSGYFTDLLRAIKMGGLPARQVFQKMLGLQPELKIWKTLNLGLEESAHAYREGLRSYGDRIGDYASQILDKVTVSETEINVDLVQLTVGEMGFKNGATRADIYKRALELGLQLCPAEVGPALRLAYEDQPKGEWILVGMEPISSSDGCLGNLGVFGVGLSGGGGRRRWLNGHGGDPGVFWDADRRWVFVRPRPIAVETGK